MLKEVPALQESVKPATRILAQMVTEAYGVASFDWQRVDELKGKRIAMAGTNAPLFMPGRCAVTLGIGEHYQAMQNGLADGSLFMVSGMEAFKLREVAKVWTKTGFGSTAPSCRS